MHSTWLSVVLSASLFVVPLSSSRLPAPLAAYPGTHQAQRPNIVLILSDDLGYGDLGSYGAPEAKTPNLDRLAKQGVRFRESYANGAVCTPTRAALMTGRYQQRVGLEVALGPDDTVNALPKTDATLPALLKQAGYATGLIGRWHLGFRQDRGPNAQGFDEFFGLLDGALDYYTHRTLTKASALFENTTPVQAHGYITDVLTERAVSFIDRHAASPFFLEIAYNAKHWPFQPPDDSAGSARRVAASTHPAMFVMRDLPTLQRVPEKSTCGCWSGWIRVSAQSWRHSTGTSLRATRWSSSPATTVENGSLATPHSSIARGRCGKVAFASRSSCAGRLAYPQGECRGR